MSTDSIDKPVNLTARFTAWVKSMPADEKYDFQDPLQCAVAQFLKESDGDTWAAWRSLHRNHSRSLFAWPMTFGSLADRLEASRSPSAGYDRVLGERV